MFTCIAHPAAKNIFAQYRFISFDSVASAGFLVHTTVKAVSSLIDSLRVVQGLKSKFPDLVKVRR